MQFWCSPLVGQLHPSLSPTMAFLYEHPPHRGTFAAFSKPNGKCPVGRGWARLELTEPLNVESTEVLCRFLENLTSSIHYVYGNFCVAGLQKMYGRTQVF